MDRGFTGVAVDVTNCGVNFERALSRHRYVMRVYL